MKHRLTTTIAIIVIIALIVSIMINRYVHKDAETATKSGSMVLKLKYFVRADDVQWPWILTRGTLTLVSDPPTYASCNACTAEHRLLVYLNYSWSFTINIIRIGNTARVNLSYIGLLPEINIIYIDTPTGRIIIPGILECVIHPNTFRIALVGVYYQFSTSLNRFRFEQYDVNGNLLSVCNINYPVSQIKWIKLRFSTDGTIYINYEVVSRMTPFRPPVTNVVTTTTTTTPITITVTSTHTTMITETTTIIDTTTIYQYIGVTEKTVTTTVYG